MGQGNVLHPTNPDIDLEHISKPIILKHTRQELMNGDDQY